MAAQRSDGRSDDASHRPTVLEPSPFGPRAPASDRATGETIAGGIAGFDRRLADAKIHVTKQGLGAAVTIPAPGCPAASPPRRIAVNVNTEVSRGGTTAIGKSFFDRGDDPRFAHAKPDPEFDAEFARPPSLLARFWRWLRGARGTRR